MQNSKCTNCDIDVSTNDKFCSNCGKRLKCKTCDAELKKDAKFCTSCGEAVESKPSFNGESKNTAKYHRKGDDIFCEVSLNNEVAKEGIVSLFDNLAGNQRIQNQKLVNGREPIFSNDETEVIEEVEIEEGTPEKKETIQATQAQANFGQQELPHIKDVEMNVECSEGDWILIYAFYLSNFGSTNFTRKAVYERYMAKRRTEKRVRNFPINWQRLFKHYLSTVNNEEIKFKKERLADIRSLILGQKQQKIRVTKKNSANGNNKKSNEPATPSTKSAKKGSSQSQSYSLLTALNLIPKEVQSLKDFYSKYTTKNNPEIFLVIIYYLEKILNEKNIGENAIYTALKHLHQPIPNIPQTLKNIHSRTGWINTSNSTDLTVTVAGENHIEYNMAKEK
jgi:hypothetical protein